MGTSENAFVFLLYGTKNVFVRVLIKPRTARLKAHSLHNILVLISIKRDYGERLMANESGNKMEDIKMLDDIVSLYCCRGQLGAV